ncbi:hypothetical protein [uncultured Maritimibacter sp.]|uniref:hypothetical protein n=1 Tax=uncultured Maritimibacter sp. TaxID=991866 RepID=UPI002597D1ED|nr:hypothetical protein [uncultured Maritimibacter sp.]
MGFRVGRRGKGEPEPPSWNDFKAEVAKAAKRKPAKKGARGPLSNLIPLPPYRPPTPEERCQFVKANGEQCGLRHMKGATRCHYHGGYRQNPTHPATVRMFREGRIDAIEAERAARRVIYALPPKERKEAQSAAIAELRARGLDFRNVTILEGIEAYRAGDGGRAWRRWCANLPTAKGGQ